MRFGAANALRGITTLRTPFLKVAATFSASMSSGRVKRRVKLLVRRSLISHFCLFFSSFLLFFYLFWGCNYYQYQTFLLSPDSQTGLLLIYFITYTARFQVNSQSEELYFHFFLRKRRFYDII